MCKMQNASRRKEMLFGIMNAIKSEIMAYGQLTFVLFSPVGFNF